MNKVVEMLKQRVYNLKLAEHVDLQGMTDIKTIMLKRQNVQAKGLSAFIYVQKFHSSIILKLGYIK